MDILGCPRLAGQLSFAGLDSRGSYEASRSPPPPGRPNSSGKQTDRVTGRGKDAEPEMDRQTSYPKANTD